MTNGEKYKTSKERRLAFGQFCKSHRECEKCPIVGSSNESPWGCMFTWLEMEAREEFLRCPFCGGKASAIEVLNYDATAVRCNGCHASSGNYDTKEDAIAAWNRRAK